MSQHFRSDSQGTEVAEMFPERVKHKTCERHALTWTRLKDLTVLFYQTSVVLSGLIRGDLAATTADALAHGGAGTIIFTGHSQPELQPVIDHINRKHPQAKIIFITADPGSLASMAAAAKTIKALGVPIDGVVGFPTVMAASWEVTADGIESHFQRNYLGYFVLVNQLLETMPAGARVILMTTSIRREAPAPKWADVNFSVSLLQRREDLYRSFLNLTCCRMASPITHLMDMHSRCLQISYFPSLLPRNVSANLLRPFLQTLEVSPLSVDKCSDIQALMTTDTKSNVQTYVSPEEVASWLQRKKEG